MAMRLYTKKELEEELQTTWGLTKTAHKTKTQQFWETPGGNYVPLVILKQGQRYPDYLLVELLKRVSEADNDC